jgi:hypothetical protein
MLNLWSNCETGITHTKEIKENNRDQLSSKLNNERQK